LLAVALGVALVAGTYILTDTIRHTFVGLFEDVNAGTSVSVRATSGFSGDPSGFGDRPTVPAALTTVIEEIPGVRAAEGSVFGFPAQLLDKRGEAIASQAPPFGTNFGEDDALTPLKLRDGRKPRGGREVTIDAGTARRHDFRVGDRIEILFGGTTREFRLVGTFGFGRADGLLGATLAAFDTPTAQELLNRRGVFDSIEVLADAGVDDDMLRARIARVLPPGIEAVTGTTVAEEDNDSIAAFLNGFTLFLLAFAFVALFVGAFIIFNTFSIIVAQRTRELALLRALGAHRRQVTQSVLAEAAALGLIGSLLGLAIGIGIAVALIALLGAFDVDVPTTTVQIQARTVLASVLLGVGVTLLASLPPAVRSARVPPIAAMRDTVVDVSGTFGHRLLTGGVVTIAGAGLLVYGLFADTSNPLLVAGVGAMLTFIGIAVLSVIAARPLARVIGAPLPRWFGVAGVLARENAMRNPRRTASTASALMIGLGLVATVSVVFASVRASLADLLNEQLSADFVISTNSFTPFSLDVAGRLDEREEIGAVSGLRFGRWQYRGVDKELQSVNPRTITELVDVAMKTGTVASLARGAVLVDHDLAEGEGWRTGDLVEMTFARTGTRSVELGGTYDDNPLLGDTIVSTETYQQNFTDALDFVVLARAADRVSVADARRAVDSVLRDYPNLKGETRDDYLESQNRQINQALLFVYSLLGLAVVIAVIGIVNTMALSVFERTREVGLLRSIGMSRRQLRRMVRWESVVVSLFGATLGMAVGIVFGGALTRSLAEEGITVYRIPVVALAQFMGIAAVAGVVAAILPARRAARLDVLEAIAAP
jgi:putative ABC transport system permease protein